jgi:type I restriction enzyme S subunit
MKLLPAGTVLVVTRSGILAHTLPIAVTYCDVTINQDIKAFQPDAGLVSTKFLAYALRALEPKILRSCTKSGTTVASVEMDRLEVLPIPIAPIAEQTRISDKLDTVLSRVDACRDRLARVAPLLKRFRQSVLAAATSGKLTEDWRVQHETSWTTGTVGDLLAGKPRNGYSPKAVDHETPTRSLTLSATTSGVFRGEHCKFIDEVIDPDSHLWLKPGDILVQRANSLEYVGVSAIFNGNANTFIYPDLMMKCNANGRASTEFLFLIFSSEPVRRYFRENATGTAGNMPKINQQTVITAPCSWPDLDEQAEIVRRVESLFAFADRLEARLTQARSAADRLTPALLAKAFRGELVPQDPDDEPAAELLKRLQADRRIAPARKTRRSGHAVATD